MQKIVTMGATILILSSLAAGCGRNSGTSPTGPTSTGTPAQSVQTITIGGDGGGGDIAGTPLTVGQSRQLKAVARLSDGSDYDITSLAKWDADDPQVATVSSTGLVTAAGSGTGRIRAAYQQASGMTTFEVADGASNSQDPLPGSGSPTTDSGAPPPASSSPEPVPGTPGIPGTPGTPGAPSTPLPPASGLPPTVQSLTITGDHTVPVGRSAQLRVIANMSDGSQQDVTGSADWKSDQPLVGSVSQSGLLSGLIPGSNVVTAKYQGATASQPVEVTPF